MSRKIIFTEGEFYHVYNRGTDKRLIFTDDSDRERFKRLLFLCNGTNPIVIRDIPKYDTYNFDRGEPLTDIGAYCLMPNHFHLLLREKNDGGISKFMNKLCTAYSMYFNLKFARTGSLFEGPFKAQHADYDQYLKYLFAYIHLNPVKIIDPDWKQNGIKDRLIAENYLNHYHYSSYLDYQQNNRPESIIINKSVFPEFFERSQDFDSYIKDWLALTPKARPL